MRATVRCVNIIFHALLYYSDHVYRSISRASAVKNFDKSLSNRGTAIGDPRGRENIQFENLSSPHVKSTSRNSSATSSNGVPRYVTFVRSFARSFVHSFAHSLRDAENAATSLIYESVS